MSAAVKTRTRDTAVIYTRLSQDRTGEGLGVQRQEQECRDLAKKLGLRVTRVYSDNDFSATSGRERPAFVQMLSDRPKAIIAWHQDRLLRLTSDLEKVIALDVPVYTSVAGTLDLSTPAGRAIARTLAAWSTYEGEQKAERQKVSNRQRAALGRWHFSRRPYGYIRRNGTIEIVEAEAEVVRECFRRYVAGETYYALAQDLNERGIRTADRTRTMRDADGTTRKETVAGVEWSMTTIRAMLRNGRYAGKADYKGEPVEPESIEWEPIIDEETWAQAEALREGRSRPGSWSRSTKHLLSGLAVCGVCEGRMLARPEYRYRSDGTRWTRTSYACTTNWCTSRSASDVDALVDEVVLARLRDKKVMARMRTTPDTEPLEAELAELSRRRDTIASLVADGLLDEANARQRAQDLTDQIDRLSDRLDALRNRSPLSSKALTNGITRRWRRLPVLDKRQIITELGMQVTIHKTPPGRRPFDPSKVQIAFAGDTP